jgi:AcrR family transcriptional regulator
MAVAENTKARLLEAAGEEFAAKGYDNASVRTICQRVGANVAAVNYHFGNKEQLYIAAVLEAHRCGTGMPPPSVLEDSPPAEQLRGYIHYFLSNVVAMGRNNRWHHALMMREMVEPTAASDVLVRESIRPRFERLHAILRKICPEADDRRLHALAFSVVGQCLHYRLAGTIARRVIGEPAYESLTDLDFLSDHIASFTLAALGLVPPLDSTGRPAAGEVVSAS